MNILLTSVGRRSYLVEYFKHALKQEPCCKGGMVHVMNSEETSAFMAADFAAVSPLIYHEQYIPFLKQYCRKYSIDLIIPLFDIDVPVLAEHRMEFEAIGVTVVTADLWAAKLCNDKWETGCYLKKHGFAVPETCLQVYEAQEMLDQGTLQWPLMVKPRWGMGSLAIYEAENIQELEVFYEKSKKKIQSSYLRYEAGQDLEHCVMIQQKLQGQEYGLDIINDLQGNYHTTIVKHKHAMRSGETDCAETVDQPELIKLGERLGNLLHHRGNLDVDVFLPKGFCAKRETSPVILELNARFGGGYPFSHMAGVNLPLAMIRWKMQLNSGRQIHGLKPESSDKEIFAIEPDREIEDLLKAEPGVRCYKDLHMIRWKPG